MAESSVFIRVLGLGSGVAVFWAMYVSVLSAFPFFLGGGFWAAGVASAFLLLVSRFRVVGDGSVPRETSLESRVG
jgi:hypothetical protein